MSMNKVFLLGRVGQEPEVRAVGDTKVATFSLATSETYKDKKTGEKRETTEWSNIVVWRGLAEVVEKYVTKGTQLFIEGKIRTRSYDDKKTGDKRYVTEIIADNLQMVGGKPSGQQSGQSIPSKYAPDNKVDDLPLGDNDDIPDWLK